MYYALVFYPRFDPDPARAIGAIRREYDPTSAFVEPHVTVLFPVPAGVGEGRLIDHIGRVLAAWRPFEIRLGGLHRSRDHWLFLTLSEGEDQVKKLYQALYTGILAEYRRADIEFVPHLGLGLFVKTGSTCDWNNPQEADLDRKRYDEALRRAKALLNPPGMLVEKLHLAKIPDEIIEWMRGKRASLPEDSKIVEVREFRLGYRGT
jgi:2'-5' RNA ligase